MTTVIAHFGLVALFAGAAWTVGRFTQRQHLAHLLWLAVFVKLLVPPFVEVPLLPAAPLAVFDPAGLGALPAAAPVLAPSVADVTAIVPPEAGWTKADVERGFLALWIAGSVLGLAWLVVSARRFTRLLEGGDEAPPAIARQVRELAADLGLRRVPAVRIVDAPISPALWPVGRATLVLPRELLGHLGDARLSAVLAHELAHFARRDHWTRLVETAAVVVYWWLPPVRWFRRELRAAEEACCDARALRATSADRRTYAEALVETAALLARRSDRLPQLATGASAVQPLARRIHAIMRPTPTRPLAAPTRALLSLGALVVLPLLPARVQDDPEPLALEPLGGMVIVAPTPVDEASAARLVGPLGLDVAGEPAVTEAELEDLSGVIELLSAGDVDAARARLEELAQPDASAVFDFTLGNVLFGEDDIDAAAIAYEQAVAKQPTFRRAWRSLGMIFVRRDDHARAAEALQRAVDLGDMSGTVHGLLGHSLSQLGEHDAAEAVYRRAQAADPAVRDWSAGLVHELFATGRHAEALVAIDELLAGGPDDALLLRLRTNALLALARVDEARVTLERVDAIGAATFDDLAILADLHANAGAWSAAVDASTRALRGGLAPDRAIRLARTMTARGAFDEASMLVDAAETFVTTVELRRSVTSVRARIALARGDHDVLVDVLERALALDPVDGEALLLLGGEFERLGRADDARSLYERATTIGGHARDAWLKLGKLAVAQGRYAEAVELLEQALAWREDEAVREYLEQVRRLGGVEVEEVPLLEDLPLIEEVPVLEEIPIREEAPERDETQAEVVERVESPAEDRTTPRIVEQPAPVLTAAMRERAPGRVVVTFVVDVDGAVRDARVESSTDAIFEMSALEAVAAWRFEPATRDGAPVETAVRLPITFPDA